ncbi:carbon-nitrogen hydrolase family protein [Methylosinus sp. H3A]|uniref:carbon-nitrogen hydrolase family protein n=1 Tax=Methylosinus sp. H3A TaxID=2785786 RepID=UPI0018C28551|nr:carbon-nitrogen hydrolase family protein [Methylosinus sp. H3A]MBG0811846.1 carbon-nitrogen hydrolase family protein [Methylosinus sp. H3A]
MKWKTAAAILLALFWTAGVATAQAPSARSIEVAAVDFIPAWGDLDGNIRRLADAVEQVARQGVTFAVFPETAVSGYLFSDPSQIAPYLDTIPGDTTKALLPILARTGMYMSVGIAERDRETGLPYNTAVLLGPKGVIGKYRKIGLNPQDQKVFAPGDTGVEVFDTPIGRIALLICYDDTYWQYARLAALRGAEIIAWHSVSDRVMPGTPAAQSKGDHSTVSNVQYMSAQNGVFVIGATRSGVETNPITGGKLYYNGGSSIWSPEGHRLVQAPVAPPEELPPGLNGVYSTTITPTDADKTRAERLALRRPELYTPWLALHRSPVDPNAAKTRRKATLVAAQWPEGPSLMDRTKPPKGSLTVLPELSGLPSGLSPAEIKSRAEEQGGSFERALAALARGHKAYVAGSYPERAGERVFHTVTLAGPDGAILGRYRATHPDAARSWATPGDEIAVIETPLGRVGLATAGELATPELGGLYGVQRTDILAAPAGAPSPLKVEIDSALFGVPDPPTGRADFFPYAAAKQNQLWLVSGGRRAGDATAAGIYGPEPVVSTPTLTAAQGDDAVRYQTVIPAAGTWIDQSQLIDGQQARWFAPLTLPNDDACLKRWREGGACPSRR